MRFYREDKLAAIVKNASNRLVQETLCAAAAKLNYQKANRAYTDDLSFYQSYWEEQGDVHPDEADDLSDLEDDIATDTTLLEVAKGRQDVAKAALLSLYPTLTEDPLSDYLAALSRAKDLAQSRGRENTVVVLRDLISYEKDKRYAWPSPPVKKLFAR